MNRDERSLHPGINYSISPAQQISKENPQRNSHKRRWRTPHGSTSFPKGCDAVLLHSQL
jgi:hypothetical protein